MNDDGEFYALGELDRVLGGEALASSPTRHTMPEWESYLLNLPKRTLRRLRGARYMRRGAMQPDELADLICARVPGIDNDSDAMAWYVKTCLVAIDERRTIARRRRHGKLARRNGYRNYYEYREAKAKERGYASVYAERMARGWGDGHAPVEPYDPHAWRRFLDSLRGTA